MKNCRCSDRKDPRDEQGSGYSYLHQVYEGGIIDEKEFMEKLPNVAELQ